MVHVYNLDDAYNLAIRAKSQILKNKQNWNTNYTCTNPPSTTFPTPVIENTKPITKTPTINRGKSIATSSSQPTKTIANPCPRPIAGKCLKCGAPSHLSSDCDCRALALAKVNLTTMEDELDKEGSNTETEEEVAEVCYLANEASWDNYTTKNYVVCRIMLAPKEPKKPSQRPTLFRTRCVVHHKILDVIIDSGSTENIVPCDIVHRLHLPTIKHPNPYKIGWIKSVGDI